MILIDHIVMSDEVLEEQFVCDLNKCKGGCCVDGDAGAPLTDEELDEVLMAFDTVKSMLTPEGLAAIDKHGKYLYDKSFGWVTPTINDGMCAYGIKDQKGVVKCAFEEAYNQGKIRWKKPISCHLFPIKIKKSKYTEQEYVNYEPRETLCAPACALGKKEKVPVYVFFKDALIRIYGE
ncbi:MAG: DUF3109 family protein, partial [Chitinophagaceae bacterium]